MEKVDVGGGGTIAYILANKGVDVIDCGVPILSMHSPFMKFQVNLTYILLTKDILYFGKIKYI